MYNNDALKCLTGEVRLSYANLVTPKPPQNGVGDPKYSVTLLIPKADYNTKNDLESAFNAAYEEGVKTKWNGRRPQVSPLIHDGDQMERQTAAGQSPDSRRRRTAQRRHALRRRMQGTLGHYLLQQAEAAGGRHLQYPLRA